MRFMLIDQIVELEPDSHVTGVKCLSNAEEYLREHFPGFPVMPGVLTLEAMTQAAAWLIRLGEDFAHSMIVLDGVRNMRYRRFVEPSYMLSVSAEIFRQDEKTTDLKAWGRVDGQTIVTGRLSLRRYNLADTNPNAVDADRAIVEKLRRQFDLLGHRHLATARDA
jgi:3-hydroxyacyl-[acyl-carrier-protein] dehydratase